MIYETGLCPRPEIMTDGQIKSELEARNLSSNGSRSELNSRLTTDNYGNHIVISVHAYLSCLLLYSFKPFLLHIQRSPVKRACALHT